MYKFKIPATTANMGPGFDTLGMALALYNYFEVTTSDYIQFLQENQPSPIPLDDNLIYTAMLKTFDKIGKHPKGFTVNLTKCEVPMSRGLGSSATCIIGGIVAANYLMGNPLSLDDIIELGTKIEGHPDNIVPAAVGGLTVSIYKNEKVTYSKLIPPKELSFSIMIPDFQVSTNEARSILPSSYSRQECVFNISRSSMLVSSLVNGEFGNLRICTEDKIHQPYRIKLIHNAQQIFDKCKDLGSLCEFISGSGSTLISIISDNENSFKENINSYLKTLEDHWVVHILKPDVNGITIIK